MNIFHRYLIMQVIEIRRYQLQSQVGKSIWYLPFLRGLQWQKFVLYNTAMSHYYVYIMSSMYMYEVQCSMYLNFQQKIQLVTTYLHMKYIALHFHYKIQNVSIWHDPISLVCDSQTFSFLARGDCSDGQCTTSVLLS